MKKLIHSKKAHKASIPLDDIKVGWSFCWDIHTQAGNKIQVTLHDDHNIYFNAWKQSWIYSDPWHAITAGKNNSTSFNNTASTNLKLSYIIWSDFEIKAEFNSEKVNNQFVELGCMYTLMIEDAKDNDYNDLCVSIFSWKKGT